MEVGFLRVDNVQEVERMIKLLAAKAASCSLDDANSNA